MLKRNSPEDSTVAAAHLQPMASARDFESEAMPYLNDLFQGAFHILQQPAKASDAVQETYFRAWKGFGESQRGANCKPWLFQILFNVLRQKHRSCFTRTVEGVSQVGQMEPANVGNARSGNQANSSRQLQEARLLSNAPDQVVSAMNRVPLDFREALLLVDCQGFSYKDAAEILGISTDIVARHIVLGRNHLYSELDACGPTLVAAAN